jgi:hypothetical protein
VDLNAMAAPQKLSEPIFKHVMGNVSPERKPWRTPQVIVAESEAATEKFFAYAGDVPGYTNTGPAS